MKKKRKTKGEALVEFVLIGITIAKLSLLAYVRSGLNTIKTIVGQLPMGKSPGKLIILFPL